MGLMNGGKPAYYTLLLCGSVNTRHGCDSGLGDMSEIYTRVIRRISCEISDYISTSAVPEKAVIVQNGHPESKRLAA